MAPSKMCTVWAGALALLITGAAAVPRGVDPAQAASYAHNGGRFTCLDGSSTFPFAQVNDNYCDCPGDGSDEPGTSACYNGKFYCANRGHQPQILSASFVDDGICDCCDGSDEKAGCKNTCLEKGAAERQVIRDKAEQMQRSLDQKQQLISEGTSRRAGWSTRASTIHAEVTAQETELARIEEEKNTMQTAADEDRKRLQAEEDERQRQQAAQQAADAAAAAAAHTEQADTPSSEETQETDEERGRRIAAQWTTDPDAAGVPAEGQEVTEEHDESEALADHEEYHDSDADYPYEDEGYDDDQLPQHPTDAAAQPHEEAAAADGGDTEAIMPEVTGTKPPPKRQEVISFMEFLKIQWAEAKEGWARELEDMEMMIALTKRVFGRLSDFMGALWEGGIQEHQRRQHAKKEQEGMRMRAHEARVRGELEAALAALDAPWRDPTWQAEAQRMQVEQATAAAMGMPWMPSAEQRALLHEATQRAARHAAGEEVGPAAGQEDAAAAAEVLVEVPAEVVPAAAVEARSAQRKRRAAARRRRLAREAIAAANEASAGAYNSHHHTPPAAAHVYSPLDNQVWALNTQLETARKKLDELRSEKGVIERYHTSGIQYDYGPGDLFASLAGRCVADTGTRWTYEACFYEYAMQKEPHNVANRVNLGSWRGWANDYTEAVFENGDACAGAPNRSFRVKLVCGETEQMWGGEEPSTCVYQAWMATPLACRQSDLDREFAKLAELERFEAEVRAEIEAKEKAAAHDEL